MARKKVSNFEEDTRLKSMEENMLAGGVRIDPVPITAGSEVTVLYNGLLSNSGADQVWIRVGYGTAQAWQDIQDLKMEKTGWGWAKKIKITDDSRFNFCFKDSADHWDNNSGANWSYEIHNG